MSNDVLTPDMARELDLPSLLSELDETRNPNHNVALGELIRRQRTYKFLDGLASALRLHIEQEQRLSLSDQGYRRK
jgi:hypothetical protein